MAVDWAADVKKYVPDADDGIIAGIVRYCGIALQKRDSSLVSFSDKTETDRVRNNFLKKKLALTQSDDVLDGAIAKVGERMKADRTKNRVTVYYLLAEAFDMLHLFQKAPAKGKTSAKGAGAAGAAAAGGAALGLASLGGDEGAKKIEAKAAAAPAAEAKPAAGIAGAVGAAGAAVAGTAVAAASGTANLAAKAVDKVEGVAGAAVAGAGSVAAKAADKVEDVASAAADTAGKAGAAVAGAVGAAAVGAAALAGSAGHAVGDAASGAASAVTGGIDKIGGAAAGLIGNHDEGESKGGMGWLMWALLALLAALVLWWLFLRSPSLPSDVETANIPAATEEASGAASGTTVADSGAQAPAEGTVAIPDGAGVTTETRDGKPVVKVYFDTGKTDVVPAFNPAAGALKSWLDGHAGSTLEVSGFNDPRGNAAANAALSKGRAEAVKAELVKAGIADAAIALVKPEASTDTAANLAGARRVEVVVK